MGCLESIFTVLVLGSTGGGFLRHIKHEKCRPETEKRDGISIRVKVVACLVALVILYSLVMFFHDRQYTPYEKATYWTCWSLGREIAYAGRYLEGLTPTHNSSTGEANRISYYAGNHCVDQARHLCLAMDGFDREHRGEWSMMRDVLFELEEVVFEGFDVRSADDRTIQVLVGCGEKLRRIGYGLLDDETGAIRQKSYTDWDGAGVVKGVVIQGEGLESVAEQIGEVIQSASSVLV